MSEQIYAGLSQQEVEERIQKGFVNEVTVSTEKTTWQIIQSNVFTYFNFIFFVLAMLLVIVQSWNNLLFLPIVIINSLIGIVQELRARKILSNMQLLHHYTAIAVRDGKEIQLETKDLVQDDIVLFSTGDQIYADAKIVSGELKVNESQLTGEADEIAKQISDTVMSGSFVVSGKAYARLEKVGDESYINQLTLKAKEVSGKEESEMVRSVNNLVKVIGFLIIPLGLLLFFQSYVTNHESFQVSIVSTVGAIIGMIPEGLYLLMTLALALGAASLARQKVLLNSMKGIESLSRVDVLCVDKTGTITKGKLTVVTFLAGDGTVYTEFTALPEMLRKATYANCVINTSAAVNEEGKIIGGNMTETALSAYMEGYKTDLGVTRTHFVPFNSTNKYSWAHVTGTYDLCLVKGAPEKLLPAADQYLDAEGKKAVLTGDMKKSLDETMVGYAKDSIRMLGLFIREGAIAGEKVPQNGLILVGIVGIRDDVRPEAVKAIKEVQRAGVQVVMITGDRRETAMAIARDAGILKEDTDIVWTSDDLSRLSDQQVRESLRHLRVVARALPMDKSRLVRIGQEMGLVVGMTGDGVNDSPALKKADVGFAMGSGTEVAKEAGDIVILDDNFLSIKQAILYGRTIYNSICRFIVFQLSINFSAVAINLLAPFLGIEKPLTIIQILWINLIMDTLAALAFGGEPALDRYLEEAPKERSAPIVSSSMLTKIILGGAYTTLLSLMLFLWGPLKDLFRPHAEALPLYTGFFCTYVFLAVMNAFNVRVDSVNLFDHLTKNRGFIEINAMIIVIQVIMTYVGGRVLRVVPLTLGEWGTVLLLSLSILVVGTLFKVIAQNH